MFPKISSRFDAHNLMVKNADKATVTSTDGDDYIDFILGNLTQIHGHNSADLKKVLDDTLSNYSNVGDYMHSGIKPLSDLILKISHQDDMRLTNSGSESMHLAFRLARAASGKNKILKFSGHYHGWFAEEISQFLPSNVSTGIPAAFYDYTVCAEWNNKDSVRKIFEDKKNDIAAIVCEPVFAHSGVIPPFDGFLDFLREVADKNGAFLIFDECITGFRVDLGGAQALYNVKADLVVYSKALSGGIPIGVVAGSSIAMAPVKNAHVFHGSTFDSNPVSVNVANFTINKMIREDTHKKIAEHTSNLVEGLQHIFKQERHDVLFQQVPGIFQFYFTNKDSIRDYVSSMQTDWKKFKKFADGMNAKKVKIAQGELWSDDINRNWLGSFFVSTAHNDNVVSEVLDRAREVIKAL